MAQPPDQVKTIFGQALDIESPEERARYLDEACGGNAALRAEVQELLVAMGHAGDFLVTRARAPGPTQALSSLDMPGTQIGPYKLLQVLGEGGMGTVFMAEQKEPVKRRVALKIIKPGMDTQQVIARFEAERQALAMMDHPNIARVLDAGTTDNGRPFFVMELVKGVSISQYCDEQHLTPRQRLELFVPVCQAVQHAHQKGIIHRDLKPSNILVVEYDHQPVPKVIDFGVAKAVCQTLTEKTMFTQYGQIVGTLEYMSPEQAKLNQLDIDTRSDIYSLGVILYELLTGTTPFDRHRLRSVAFDELLRIIREEEPPKPSTRVSTIDTLASIAANRRIDPHRLGRVLRGDLDWVVMKAIDKDRARRYETANALMEDVQRYLMDEPVLACPPSLGYRFTKFARRYRTALAASCLAVLILLVVVGGIGWLVRDRVAREQEIARERSEREAKIAREQAAQLALNEQFITRALELSRDHMHKGQWDSALVEAKRAEAALSSGLVSDEVRGHVADQLNDLTMAFRLDEIRTLPPETKMIPACLQVLQEYGIDVDALEVNEAARQICARSIPRELALALDDMATRDGAWNAAPDDPVRRQSAKYLQIAKIVDTDPWRQQIRDYMERRDIAELEKLAARTESLSQPAATISMLAWVLKAADKSDRAAALLTAAYDRYRDDFRLNYVLGAVLENDVERLRYQQAASALRPHSPGLLNNIAMTLDNLGRRTEAIALYRKAIESGGAEWKWSGVHVNLAKALEANGQLEEAVESLRRAIAIGRKDATAYFELARVLNQDGPSDEASELIRQAIDVCGDERDKQVYLAHGLNRVQRYAAARDAAQQAVDHDPRSAESYFQLALSLDGLGELDASIASYRRVLELRPNDAPAWHNLGLMLKKSGQIDEAIVCLQKSLELKPNLVPAINSLGGALCDKGELEKAKAMYQRAVEIEPTNATAHWGLGGVLDRQQQWPEAAASYRRAIAADPKRFELHASLATVLGRLEELDAAVSSCREALTLKPDELLMHVRLANFLERQGKQDEAAASWALVDGLLAQNNAASLKEAAQVLNGIGQVDRAIVAYRAALQTKPDDSQLLRELGESLLKQGRLDEATDVLRRVVEMDPQAAPAQYQYGLAFDKQGRLDEAAACYERVLAEDPNHVLVLGSLGQVRYDQQRFDEAISYFRRGLSVNPRSAALHHNLGLALHEQGKLPDAVIAYGMALELNPTLAPSQYSLGKTLATLGTTNDAIDHFRRAVELDPRYAEAHNQAGILLRGLKRHEEALGAFQAALEIRPDSVPYLNNLANTLENLGRTQEAEATLRRALELNPQYGNTYHNLGSLLMDQGQFDEAIELLGKAAHTSDVKAISWRLRGQAASQAGRFADALESFEAALKMSPDEPFLKNDLAWLLANCPEQERRDPQRAVQLAASAAKSAQNTDQIFKTLGVSHYRAGDFAAARNSLHAALAMSGVNAVDLFFLAMTYWRLDHQDEAREWFHKGVKFMDQQANQDPEVVNARAEAAALLGLADTK